MKFSIGQRVRLVKWDKEAGDEMFLWWDDILKDGGPNGVVERIDKDNQDSIGIRLSKDKLTDPWWVLTKYIRARK